MPSYYYHRRPDPDLEGTRARLAELRRSVAHISDPGDWPREVRSEVTHHERVVAKLEAREAERQRLAAMTPSAIVDMAMGIEPPRSTGNGDGNAAGAGDGPLSREQVDAIVTDMMERR